MTPTWYCNAHFDAKSLFGLTIKIVLTKEFLLSSVVVKEDNFI